MKAETVFEVYKSLNHFEQNRVYELITIDLNKTSKLDSYEDIIKIIAENIPSFFNFYNKK